MKEKILTGISAIMLFIPWTIFILRRFSWALEMPTAKLALILCIALDKKFEDLFYFEEWTARGD